MAAEKHFIAVDLVRVYSVPTKEKKDFKTILGWGDEITVVEQTDNYIKISLRDFVEKTDGSILPKETYGYIRKPSGGLTLADLSKPLNERNVFQVSMVDVQQGDGCVIETPTGKVVLIDGGENQMFARYLAGRFHGTDVNNPKEIDCIVVTHGDADHFEGLPKILESETNNEERKRLFINPRRIYHNGIVKRPSSENNKKVKDTDLLGKTVESEDQLYLTELYDNLLDVQDKRMNAPFLKWKQTIQEYEEFYSGIELKRLDNNSKRVFDFLSGEGLVVNVLGPIIEKVDDAPALKFLRAPSKSVKAKLKEKSGSYSASHTINGHSIILKFTYGNVNFLFSGDLNEEAENMLINQENILRSEVLKVPHHGSADFSNAFFKAVNPVISVVSSGDENEVKEYIHPRATVMGALGKHSRIDRPLIFVTELTAFFKTEGWSTTGKGSKQREFFGFSRSAFGIIHVRTDGSRLLVFTHSGQKDLKEAYAFTVKENGEVEPENVVLV